MEMLPNEEMVKGVLDAVPVCGATIQYVLCVIETTSSKKISASKNNDPVIIVRTEKLLTSTR